MRKYQIAAIMYLIYIRRYLRMEEISRFVHMHDKQTAQIHTTVTKFARSNKFLRKKKLGKLYCDKTIKGICHETNYTHNPPKCISLISKISKIFRTYRDLIFLLT